MSAYLLELMAWVYINRPEQFENIMSAHKEGDMNVIDLEDFDIETIKNKANILDKIEE
jgi:hypothetical protein